MAFLLTLDSDNRSNINGTTDDIYFRIYPPKDLRSVQYECALLRIDGFASYYNITTEYGNRNFTYHNGVDWVTVVLDEGVYSFNSLTTEIKKLMKAAGDYTVVDGEDVFDIEFYLDLSSGLTEMTLTSSYQVDFTGTNLRKIFGFDAAVYQMDNGDPTVHVSESVSDISNGVNSILVHFSPIAGMSITNGQPSDVIYTFGATYAPFEAFHVEGKEFYIPLYARLASLSDVRLYLTDEHNRPLRLNNTHLSATFAFRPSRE